jgi:magnesium-protoporphyrin O-methyltransferase
MSGVAMTKRSSYETRKGELETYFDRTANAAWEKLTSTAPVGRIRAKVRAGRDEMRATLLSWLPADMTGLRLLDAGCGTGALALEAARRGAEVVAIDISPNLVAIAAERAKDEPAKARIDWRVGDMLDPSLGEFDHVVAMDSLIHYEASDIVRTLSGLGVRTRHSMLMTFAPATPLLRTARMIGLMFPRSDRAPAIVPTGERDLHRRISRDVAMNAVPNAMSDLAWKTGRTQRVAKAFYISQALELTR